MKGLGDFMESVTGLMAFLRHKSTDLAKIEASIYYLKAVQTARLAVLGILGLMSLVIMMMTAFIAIHLFVFFVLPVSVTTRAWLAGGLTMLDLTVVGTALYFISSEKMWMKLTKAGEVAEHTMEETSPELVRETPIDTDALKSAL